MPKTIVVAGAAMLVGCGLLAPPPPPVRTLDGAPAPAEGAPRPGDPGSTLGAPPLAGYQLAWHDEFDGTALDATSWTVDTGVWRDGLNAADALEVTGGVLSFFTFTDGDGLHHAGHINTRGKLERRYGYYEARVKLVGAPGQWCSFFLFPWSIGNPVGDPGTAGVEVDVFEHRETDEGGWPLDDMIQVGLNWDGFGPDWKFVHLVVGHPDDVPLEGAWHVYSVLWTEAGYAFFIDGLPVYETSAAVSRIAEPIYLTCEVWDGSWVGSVPPGGYGSRATSTPRMAVDWVRVWEPVDPAAR